MAQMMMVLLRIMIVKGCEGDDDKMIATRDPLIPGLGMMATLIAGHKKSNVLCLLQAAQ